jgi:hypothetical protein
LIPYAIGFVSEIITKKAVMAPRAIKRKRHVTRIFDIEALHTLKTSMAIGTIYTSFTSVRSNQIHTIYSPIRFKGIASILRFKTAMEEIAILTRPSIFRIFTILILGTNMVLNRTLFEELFCLLKKWLVKIKNCFWWHSRTIPFVLVPNRIRTLRSKYRDNIPSCFITFPLMERPMGPKSAQVSNTKIGRKW